MVATYILKTLKLERCIHLFISASEDSQRLRHTVSIDFSIFVLLELFGVAPVMRLDLFLWELLSSVSETTSLSSSEFSSELFSEVTVPSQKDNYRIFSVIRRSIFSKKFCLINLDLFQNQCCVLQPSILMKWNARMSYFLTLNWYKTKNRKNTKLRVLVIDFTRHGGSEKNRVGSEKSHFIFSAAGTFYCSSSPSLLVSNSLSTTSSAFSFLFSSSQTASSSEPSTALAIPQDLNNFWIKSLGISFQARLIQVNTSSLLGALFFPDRVYVNGPFTIRVS